MAEALERVLPPWRRVHCCKPNGMSGKAARRRSLTVSYRDCGGDTVTLSLRSEVSHGGFTLTLRTISKECFITGPHKHPPPSAGELSKTTNKVHGHGPGAGLARARGSESEVGAHGVYICTVYPG